MAHLNHQKKYSVIYGQKTIDFSLHYCNRKTIEIAVHPDSSVIVKAPEHSEIELIEKKITKRARWILRQLSYFRQFNPRTPDRRYISGETHLYLGRQYRLKLAKGSENSVKLSRGFFHVICRNEPTQETAKKVLDQWYSNKAHLHFAESLDRCWEKFGHLEIDRPKLFIKRMQKRWGSLSSKGTITLNTNLIKASKECIDYVVTHELCHLVHHDHSPEFYMMLDSFIPGWEKVKHKLELSLA